MLGRLACVGAVARLHSSPKQGSQRRSSCRAHGLGLGLGVTWQRGACCAACAACQPGNQQSPREQSRAARGPALQGQHRLGVRIPDARLVMLVGAQLASACSCPGARASEAGGRPQLGLQHADRGPGHACTAQGPSSKEGAAPASPEPINMHAPCASRRCRSGAHSAALLTRPALPRS